MAMRAKPELLETDLGILLKHLTVDWHQLACL